MMQGGKFITFEGIDGAGKTTHLEPFRARLEARVAQQGRSVVVTREPGGTPLGESLRDMLLHQPMHLETEALLMFAARREHLASVILPALAGGDWVLCDRFTDATFAYQGGGRGLPREKLARLEAWVQDGFAPDLTILFDVPVEVANQRRALARVPDRFERQDGDFFERVRAEYLRRVAENPARFHIIDGTQPIAAVAADLDALVERL